MHWGSKYINLYNFSREVKYLNGDLLDKEYWNGLIKMSLSRLFILRVLYDESSHGYALTKKIADLTSGCCAPTEGTLYPALREFEQGGYLSSHKEVVSGRERKVYALTEKGIKAYKTALDAWEETARVLLTAQKEMQT